MFLRRIARLPLFDQGLDLKIRQWGSCPGHLVLRWGIEYREKPYAPNYAPKSARIAIDQDGLLRTKKRPEPLISRGFLAFYGMLRNGKWWCGETRYQIREYIHLLTPIVRIRKYAGG